MQYQKNFYQMKSNTRIFKEIEEEVDTVGYYDLPQQDTTEIQVYAKTIKQKYIAVIGIGGSTLGTHAIHSFLTRSP